MQNQELYTAEYWELSKGGVRCTLCPHTCLLKDGETGVCRTRKCVEDKLVSLVYGYPCALHIDPVEKKPLYHFKPSSQTFSLSTTGCNLRCLNCQNFSISQKNFSVGEFDYVAPQDIVRMAMDKQCRSVSYTYTEPIIYYEYMRDVAVVAHEKGLANIMVSAGYINKKPLRDLCRYIDAANIDLKCFNNKTYQKLSKVDLTPVLNTLELLKEEGVCLEITNLMVPGYTDDLKEIGKMCQWLVDKGFDQVPLHFSRFYGTHKLSHLQTTSIEKMEKAFDIAKQTGIKYVYLGNVRHTSAENTYCPACHQLLIERNGYATRVSGMIGSKCTKCSNEIYGVFD
ncbi:AmmeMemoRadiSam system radical SAM enzyme [Plebeiibacterium marinum]|uniref:AmmeMemoRadiSam system radical SAM enzyme n=1 Tax=Plebeiibacterium marinum TaxID=2992111 RepID=A0AAE3MGD3_9BACT|nr:AmmeMemoRadiSam system radical SAM enzyme [Plebeiobacterium marinum]MCW3807498.1 AmmeMemoRadiSam system radical SAM enzyme [Plebeiobacterium marinum]